MVICSALISLRDIIYGVKAVEQEAVLAPWVAVLGGLATTICFTSNQMLCKHFLRNKIFKLEDISYFAFGTTNLVLFVAAIAFWTQSSTTSFNWDAFKWGTLGSIINTLGKICVQNACAKGPAGPASAIVSTNGILLLLFDNFVRGKVLRTTDIIAVAVGIFGCIYMTIPRQLESLFRCVFCCREKDRMFNKLARDVDLEVKQSLKQENLSPNNKNAKVEF